MSYNIKDDESSADEDETVFELPTTSSTPPTDDELALNEPEGPVAPPRMTARAYQLEMLEESLKRNIIVAMDTGSGKTHVAILRIMKELERSDKRVWFLAPTVLLAEQQCQNICLHIPSVQSRLITGNHNVDSWSEQRIWDAFLENIHIVVSTHDILFQAMMHGFVRLEELSLIVFDEAHNCVKRHPGARLMNERYWPAKKAGLTVPHILGLTASPVLGSKLEGIEELERTLDSTCRTPSTYREELITHVNRPEMLTRSHEPLLGQVSSEQYTRTMVSLYQARQRMDMRRDPYILHLRNLGTEKSKTKLVEALEKKKTYCQDQMRAFWINACDILRQVGGFAVDYYIRWVITEFNARAPKETENMSTLPSQERAFLAEALRNVECHAADGEANIDVTHKVQVLIDTLKSHKGDNPLGIVFAEQRAVVTALAHVLSKHPDLKDRYRVSSMVGMSKYTGRRDFAELGRKDDQSALLNFRTGKLNLLVATSVLEEGIDVPACNLVICFDPPKSLKSFVQRRGRARMHSSQLYLLVGEEMNMTAEWHKLEEEMKQRYQDEARERDGREVLDEDHDDYPVLRSKITGACLRLRDAKQHLDHFCNTLSTRKYVDWSPYYTITDVTQDDATMPKHHKSLLKATVHLPMSMAPELRRAESLRVWRSEKNAILDAAFQAYIALYRAGLLNENLLPRKESVRTEGIEARDGLVMVNQQINPWVEVAKGWRDGKQLHRRRIVVSDMANTVRASLELVLPVPIPEMRDLVLHWDATSSWKIAFDGDDDDDDDEDVEMSLSPDKDETDHTASLIRMAWGHRWKVHDRQNLVRFVSSGLSYSLASEAEPFRLDVDTTQTGHLIREPGNSNSPYFYLGWLPCKPPLESVRRTYRGFEQDADDVPYMVIQPWPKKAGYLDPRAITRPVVESSKPYPRVLPASRLKVDGVPAVYSHFGMMIPGIMHELGARLLASDLMLRLAEVDIRSLDAAVTAITTPVADRLSNYNKVEFLGDTILKVCTTVNCCAENPDWPEGYLSYKKDKIVSNSRLSKASKEFGLDKYIRMDTFTLHKWRPTYVDDLLAHEGPAALRQMATKTLADVVEALIGTCYVEGGIPKALVCMRAFLPEERWESLECGRQILFDNAPADMDLHVTLQPLEDLLGYRFRRKSLLIEAMTHPSYVAAGAHASLDRLEFLGDAVLDFLVVTSIFDLCVAHGLEHFDMHLLRTALVNADFLGFLTMKWGTPQAAVDIVSDSSSRSRTKAKVNARGPELAEHTVMLSLSSFLRYSSPEMASARAQTEARFAVLGDDVATALAAGTAYPWALLARLRSQKFYSDVFESVLGAVWVDSGSFDAARAVLERAGLMGCLRRFVEEKVHMMHPKEELGRLAVSKKVEYVVAVDDGDGDEDGAGDMEVTFKCTVSVGDELVAAVKGGGSREDARTWAAQEAVRILKERVAV